MQYQYQGFNIFLDIDTAYLRFDDELITEGIYMRFNFEEYII